MTTGHFILNPDHSVKEVSTAEWVEFFESKARIIEQEMVGNIFVSTVFLGLDHSFGYGPPIVFETMCFDRTPGYEQKWEFGGKEHTYSPDLLLTRYATWDEAVAGHCKAVEMAKGGVEAFKQEV